MLRSSQIISQGMYKYCDLIYMQGGAIQEPLRYRQPYPKSKGFKLNGNRIIKRTRYNLFKTSIYIENTAVIFLATGPCIRMRDNVTRRMITDRGTRYQSS